MDFFCFYDQTDTEEKKAMVKTQKINTAAKYCERWKSSQKIGRGEWTLKYKFFMTRHAKLTSHDSQTPD